MIFLYIYLISVLLFAFISFYEYNQGKPITITELVFMFVPLLNLCFIVLWLFDEGGNVVVFKKK